MLILAHPGRPVAPHDLWQSWNVDPILLLVLFLLAWVHGRGRAPGLPRLRDRWRSRAFTAGLLALGLALLSPLEPLSGALASAHMVQHLLLVAVAAPLLAFSAPGSRLLRGLPLPARRTLVRGGARLRPAAGPLRHAGVAWMLHVAALWLWHSAVLYGAALRHPVVHAAEHAAFLGTGLLFWHGIVGGRSALRRSPGLGIALVFAMAMQGVFLSVLLTFAGEPWYGAYASTTAAWGLSPLADQQLAGVVMWVPGGLLHLGVALVLLRTWLGPAEPEPTTPVPPPPTLPTRPRGARAS